MCVNPGNGVAQTLRSTLSIGHAMLGRCGRPAAMKEHPRPCAVRPSQLDGASSRRHGRVVIGETRIRRGRRVDKLGFRDRVGDLADGRDEPLVGGVDDRGALLGNDLVADQLAARLGLYWLSPRHSTIRRARRPLSRLGSSAGSRREACGRRWSAAISSIGPTCRCRAVRVVLSPAGRDAGRCACRRPFRRAPRPCDREERDR